MVFKIMKRHLFLFLNMFKKNACALTAICIGLCILCINKVQAQIYSSNLRAEVNVPKVISNKALARTFKGIYDVQAAYYIYLTKGFNFGLGSKFTFTQIDWQKFQSWKGAYYAFYGGYASLAYDIKTEEKQKLSLIFDMGYAQNQLGKLLVDTNPSLYSDAAIFWQPKIQYQFYIDPNIAITLNLSYTNFQTTFNPKPVGLSRAYTYKGTEIKGYNGYINFGIGILTGFKGKRFKDAILPDYDTEVVPAEEP
jgi:hypothetical protein